MAKFCTKCGKQLEEGQVCDCSMNTQPTVAATTTSSNGFDFNECLNSYISIIKGIFVKPVDTIKKYATTNNFLLGIISLALNCIVSGIFLYCMLNECMSMFSGLLGFGSAFSLGASIDIPFMKVFLYGILFMAAGFAVTAVMIYLIAGVILKDKINIKEAFSLVGVCSVFTTVTTVVTIVLTYISIKFMFIVLLLAGIFYLTHLYQGISDKTELDKNKLAYVFVPAIGVATFVVVYVLPKILF